jgi:protein-disulfide isomerase-like protein with CxxC motif
MSQGYKNDDAPDVWDDPSRDDELLALAVSTSIRDLQPGHFIEAHEALFRARHERAIRLVTEQEIRDVLSASGVDVDAVFVDVATRRPHHVIGDSFRSFERYEAFGVPTFVVNDDATFVRYMNPPTKDASDSIALITSLVELMSTQSALNEFKHTKVSR